VKVLGADEAEALERTVTRAQRLLAGRVVWSVNSTARGGGAARRRVRHVHRYRSLRGWRCSSGSRFRTGGYCSRARSYFGWHPGD
jgi:hypothetical protein